jgi:hypothetical protein
MEKIEFNTGRKYATNGQPIVAVRIGETVIFKDEARLIVGTFELPAGQPLSQSAVMRAYDNYGYHMAAWKKEYDVNPEPVYEPEPVKESEKVFYTFTWRKEEGGDFYEQAFEADCLRRAVERWQDFWGLDESTCFVFEVKKEGF